MKWSTSAALRSRNTRNNYFLVFSSFLMTSASYMRMRQQYSEVLCKQYVAPTLEPFWFTHTKSLKFILNLSLCIVWMKLPLKCGKLNYSPATGLRGCVDTDSPTLQQRIYNVLTWEQGLTSCYCYKLSLASSTRTS